MNGHNLSPRSIAINPETIAFREMRSKAPTPSIDTTGASSSRLVSVCNAWVTATVPALVDKANWLGMLLGQCAGNDAENLRPPMDSPVWLVERRGGIVVEESTLGSGGQDPAGNVADGVAWSPSSIQPVDEVEPIRHSRMFRKQDDRRGT